ncbi:LytR C-terminal domain-containing protein, partial [Patescibacteria group bacterium]|nr:LytR C-terminal domain-containing protein [Patescibacteria group bacterium]
RLYLYAKKVPVSSIIVEEASISDDVRDFNKDASLLLTDNVASAENISVQIINAAGQSGLGGRLERVILNFGGNVVSVKTALVIEPISKIQYYGQETYTLNKLERYLSIKKERLDKEDIARIVITIGEDIKNTLLF